MGILAQDYMLEMVLPFLLVFVVIFAILEKSKLLGDKKHQINMLVALVFGFLSIAFPQPREIMVSIIPWIAVGISVLLVFFILYGFVAGDLTKMPKGLKITFGVLAGIFTIGVIIYVTGIWDVLNNFFGEASTGGSFITTLAVLGIIIWVVVSSK